MAGSSGYEYAVRFPPAAITVAKTLIQVKCGAAPIDILGAWVYQTTKTSTEYQLIQHIQYTGAVSAGTGTSVTPLPLSSSDPAALAVGGVTATAYNLVTEPTGGTANILHEESWNILNGVWQYLPVPEGRIRIAQTKVYGLKLNTAPAASQTTGAVVHIIEYQ